MLYMNETNIVPRQRFILNLINQLDGFLRGEIQCKVEISYKVSKQTLIRDLNKLARIKFIRVGRKGKSTKYFPFLICSDFRSNLNNPPVEVNIN